MIQEPGRFYQEGRDLLQYVNDFSGSASLFVDVVHTGICV